jgi:hypothetical protein
MYVTVENLTLRLCPSNLLLEEGARRDVLDVPWETSRGLRQVDRTRGAKRDALSDSGAALRAVWHLTLPFRSFGNSPLA